MEYMDKFMPDKNRAQLAVFLHGVQRKTAYHHSYQLFTSMIRVLLAFQDDVLKQSIHSVPAESRWRNKAWRSGAVAELRFNMSGINGVGGSNPVHMAVNPSINRTGATESAQPRAADRLELSGATQHLLSLKTNDVRADKVASIRAQIEAGTYDDEQKLDIAIDRLLDDLKL
jgi:anti-sigma28 factor (negative regulator of flagellin synthesis)